MNLFWNSIISPTAYGGGASRNLTEWKGSWIWRRLRRFIGRYGRSGRWRSRRWLDRGGAGEKAGKEKLKPGKNKSREIHTAQIILSEERLRARGQSAYLRGLGMPYWEEPLSAIEFSNCLYRSVLSSKKCLTLRR